LEIEKNKRMSDDDDVKANLKKFKPKKPKITVPAEFLDNAKSYEDKLMLVKFLSEKEKNRVVLIFKKMISQGIQEAKIKKGLK
jgi:hypothetical protein